MMKIFSMYILLLSLSYRLFADTNSYDNINNKRVYDPNYYDKLSYCNSLPTNFQRQMCRLGLFSQYSL